MTIHFSSSSPSVMLNSKIFLYLCLTLPQLVMAAYAAEPTLRVAVVASPEVDQFGITDSVTVKLAEMPEIEMVNRSSIARVRDELDLAALCAPEAVKGRQALGKTLGADLLVVLQVVEPKAEKVCEGLGDPPAVKRIHAVVTDCRCGVRLADTFFSLAPEKSSRAIFELITKICKKHTGGIQQIVGIMPLVPESSYGRIESLHTGLGPLIGKLLLRDTTFAVLDSKECLLIERERLLGTIPNTSVPITIIKGSYLVDFDPYVKPDVQLKFEAIRNGKTCGKVTLKLQRVDLRNLRLPVTSMERMSQFLHKVLRTPLKIRCTPEDLAVTLEELIKQIEQQANIGAVDQVCCLAEMALLINPDKVSARLYAIGGYLRWCPILRNSGAEPATIYQPVYRQIDHIEYLVRNRQISVARASQLYVVSRFVIPYNKKFYDMPMDSEPISDAEKECGERYCQSVLPMMRDLVRNLPMKNHPSLVNAFTYSISPGPQEKRGAPHQETYDPNSRFSQIFCWSTCVRILSGTLHRVAHRCYQDAPERYRAIDQAVLALEEERIRKVSRKGFAYNLASHHIGFWEPSLLRRIWLRYPEVASQYKAMFDRFEQDDDIVIKIYGMAGNFAMMRYIEGNGTGQLETVPDVHARQLRKILAQLEKIYAICQVVEPKEMVSTMRFDWNRWYIRVLRSQPVGMQNVCISNLKLFRRLVRQTPFLETVPEDIDSESLLRAEKWFRHLNKMSIGNRRRSPASKVAASKTSIHVVSPENPAYRDSSETANLLPGEILLGTDAKVQDMQELQRLLPNACKIDCLIIERVKLTEEDFRCLSRYSIKFVSLNLPPDENGYSSLNDKTLPLLLKNERLRNLHIQGNGLTDDAFATIGNAKQLQCLQLRSDRFSGRVLAHIAKAPQLRYLMIQGPNFTNQSLLLLLESKNLPDLIPVHTQITVEGLARLYSKWKQKHTEKKR